MMRSYGSFRGTFVRLMTNAKRRAEAPMMMIEVRTIAFPDIEGGLH
jgi:hypothetical protein